MDSLFTLFCIPLRSSASSAVRFSPVVRSGISLLEVLIAIFVLSIGLLGIASLIPLGKLAMMETEKSDRTGACGRAALRDVKVRRMLAMPTLPALTTDVYAVDPLGVDAGLPGTLANVPVASGLSRVTLLVPPPLPPNPPTTPISAELFRWQDELSFDISADATMRPRIIVQDSTLPTPQVGPYPQLPGEPPLIAPLTPVNNGNYSWFFTVSPQNVAGITTGAHSISIVVCQGNERLLAGGEEAYTLPNTQLPISPSYAGASLSIPAKWPTGWNLKKNDWVLVYSTRLVGGNRVLIQTTWYRVVFSGYDEISDETNMTLVGPDWHGNDDTSDTTIELTVIAPKGVTGVYTTTVQLDSDLIWSQ